ncbi:MAG TPA: hypothetical protein VM737_11615 [Gemmatimonadota bacterium]|nr:hypothetical protein [Gemmatimonadota bacterium]
MVPLYHAGEPGFQWSREDFLVDLDSGERAFGAVWNARVLGSDLLSGDSIDQVRPASVDLLTEAYFRSMEGTELPAAGAGRTLRWYNWLGRHFQEREAKAWNSYIAAARTDLAVPQECSFVQRTTRPLASQIEIYASWLEPRVYDCQDIVLSDRTLELIADFEAALASRLLGTDVTFRTVREHQQESESELVEVQFVGVEVELELSEESSEHADAMPALRWGPSVPTLAVAVG